MNAPFKRDRVVQYRLVIRETVELDVLLAKNHPRNTSSANGAYLKFGYDGDARRRRRRDAAAEGDEGDAGRAALPHETIAVEALNGPGPGDLWAASL